MTRLLLALLCLTALLSSASAQTYPTRPITMVVPFSAGGPTDTVARILGQAMGTALGQPVIIENVTGAAGSIGVGRVARAAPDGYTIGIGHWSTHVVNAAVYHLNYDVLEDFAPISLVANNAQLIVSKNDVPAKNLKELIAWVKANQDKIVQGTGGVGAASHIGGLFFQQMTGTKFQFVPYRGTGPMMQDLLAGQIDFSFDQAANSLPQVQAGRIRGYAVTSKTRIASAPDIPTVDEAGLPGFYVSVWHGLRVPKGTPKAIVDKLVAATQTALKDANLQKRWMELGQDLPPPEQQGPEALRAYHKAEVDKWLPIIKAAGVRAE